MINTTLSVIIPTLNEAATITAVIDTIEACETTEILVVDGGSTDNTCALATQAGATVFHTPPGRAPQMNAGANYATGSILLFLHGDTLLPKDNNHLIEHTLQLPGVSCGAFSLCIDSGRWSLHCIATGANLRSKLFQLPYGDQGLFTTAETFHTVGSFPELPIMEDYYFVRSLGKRGKIIILPQAVTTSSRRWDNMGIFKTTLVNQLIIIGHLIGISPARLARLYQRAKGVKRDNHA